MNMIDQARMVPPPAPQPVRLQRLRVVSGFLLFYSAMSAVFIKQIAAIGIYAVAFVALMMLAAVVSAAVYWIRRQRLEREYWTDDRYTEHMVRVVEELNAKADSDRTAS